MQQNGGGQRALHTGPNRHMENQYRRVCLITGASGLLGSRLCDKFRQTYRVAAVHLRHRLTIPTQYQEVIDPLNHSQPLAENEWRVFGINADLTNDSELERIVDLVLARFDNVDVLINAAGSCIARPVIADEQLMQSAEYQFRINALVPLKLTKLLLDRAWRISASDNARANRNVINISSIAGVEVFSNGGYVGYGASKAALNFLTCSLAQELRPFGVRVNAIAPNSFPSAVSIDRVVAVIEELNTSTICGKIMVLDSGREYEYAYSNRT